MDASAQFAAYVKAHPDAVGKVVDFDAATDRFLKFDLTETNTELNAAVVADTGQFSSWINNQLKANNCRYGIGGYMEHRTLYARSPLFDAGDEPRRLHLGIDIWGDAGIPVYSPLDGIVHSFKDNDNFGDYGPTILLQHNLGGLNLYSLYGHLSRESITDLVIGQTLGKDQQIGTFGNSAENGHWPPHLHFQLMFDLEGYVGDYPGVGRYSEKEKLIKNIPDPGLLLRLSEL